MEYIETSLWTFSSKICNINASESHSNTTIHQLAMNPFSQYLVILQYVYFKYRDMVFTNTAHP